jgi:hypothetical protein
MLAIIQNCKFIIMLFDSLEEDRILSQEERQLREQSYERLALELKQRAAYWKQQQQQHSLLSQASWGRLEMKPKRDDKQGDT